MTTVSVAMIVKNEAHTLARCLDSVAGAVDEIVVVDTGSTDDTKAVTRRYTDHLFDFAWQDDFAAARQFAFDRATGAWVLWLDADDVVRGADQIRPGVAGAPDHVDGFYWRYVVDWDDWGNERCVYWRERCVRNDGSFRWSGRVHEVLVPQGPRTLVRDDRVVVEHRSTAGDNPARLARNLALLEAELAASNGAPPPRLLFYLGRDHASAGNLAQALDYFHRYLQVAAQAAAWDEERYLAQTQVAELHRAQEAFAAAIDADLAALKICPHWPDAYFGLARSYYFRQEWHKVIHWTEVGRAMPRPETIHITNPLAYEYDWIVYYTNALYHVGETAEALAWTRHALARCPDDPWHRHNFFLFSGAPEEIAYEPAIA